MLRTDYLPFLPCCYEVKLMGYQGMKEKEEKKWWSEGSLRWLALCLICDRLDVAVVQKKNW